MRTRLALTLSMFVPALVAAQAPTPKSPAEPPVHVTAHAPVARSAAGDTTHKARATHRRRTHRGTSATTHGAAVKATTPADSAHLRATPATHAASTAAKPATKPAAKPVMKPVTKPAPKP